MKAEQRDEALGDVIMRSGIFLLVGLSIGLVSCRFDPVATLPGDGGVIDVVTLDRELPDVGPGDGIVRECDPTVMTSRCASDGITVQTCGVDGQWSDTTVCDLACAARNNAAYCAETLVFSNNVPYYSPDSAVTEEITGQGCVPGHPIVIDTDADTAADAVRLDGNPLLNDPLPDPIFQPLGHGIAIMVLPLVRFVVPEGCRVRVKGGRALAIVAVDEIDISGTLDASADALVPGPGALGGLDCDGGDGQDGGANGLGGGGGAGRYGAGGKGGGGNSVAGASGDPLRNATLVPLMGGCRGGSGAERVVSSTLGGLGGGALMLASGGTIRVSGTVRVSGGSGASSQTAAGGGGGSGGSLLLEAPHVVVAGRLEAEGGRGGTGGTAQGGAGGAADHPDGEPGTAVGGTGGGGGGGAGQIRINTLPGMPVEISGVLSPEVQFGAQVGTGLKAE